MTLTLILIALSITLSIVTYIYGGFYESLIWVWLPFALMLLYFWALFFLHALYMAAFSFVTKRIKNLPQKPRRYGMWMLSQTCYILSFFFRVRLHATGLGKLPDPKTKFMIVSNHLSGFDHVFLISIFAKHRMVCVSKNANLDVILAGGWMRYAGYLYIDQNDMLSGTKVIEKAGQYIKDGLCSVCIAPEGTRNKTFPEPELLPFHPGSFAMAYQSKCPIAVFAIQNTNCIFKRWPLRHTDVYFDCVGVLEYEEYCNLTQKELAEKTRGLIARRFEQKHARFYHLKPKKTESAE